MGLVSWPFIIFMFPASILALWWTNIRPIMGFLDLKKNHWLNWLVNKGFRDSLKKCSVSIRLILVFAIMEKSHDPYSFSSSQRQFWPKMGFPGIFKTNIGWIHLIPDIYLHRVSLLIPINFHVPSVKCGPLVAKYLAKDGICRLKTKTNVGTPKNPRPPLIHKSQLDYPFRPLITDLPTFENLKTLFFQTFHEKKLWKVVQSISVWTDIENPYRLSRASYTFIYMYMSNSWHYILTISPTINLPGGR